MGFTPGEFGCFAMIGFESVFDVALFDDALFDNPFEALFNDDRFDDKADNAFDNVLGVFLY